MRRRHVSESSPVSGAYVRPIVLSAAAIVVRLVAWSGLAGGAIWLWPGSQRPSSLDMIESSGLKLIRRSVEDANGKRRRTPLEIYVPAQGAAWDSASGQGHVSSAGLKPSAEKVRQSSSAVAEMSGRRPALIAIHGGSWIGGSPRLYRLDPENTVLRLARAGLVVVVPEYQLARPGDPTWPAVLEELRDVVRWVRRHAVELEIDPDRIAALGQSAGGQLAALLGMLPDDPGHDTVSARISAVIDFYGPTDLARLVEARELAHDPVRIFLGERAANNRQDLRAASPIEHTTSDGASMLLLHGSDDAWVPPQQSTWLAEALKRAGVRHQLIEVEGARHGFEAGVNTTPKRDLLPEIIGFLRSVWN